jgi:hypothetical protein
MKKLSILLIGLLLVSGLAFADFGTVEIEGDASVTWGIDLNSNATGFMNAGSSSVTLTLIDEASAETMGDDGLYGYIIVEEYELLVEDGAFTSSIGAVSASIFVDPAEIVIYSAPGMAWGSADAIEAADPDIAPTLGGANTIGGITIIVPAGPAEVSVYVVSDGDWTSNAANDYAAGADLVVEVAPITVSVGGFYGWFNAAGTWGATALAEVALDALEGVDIWVGSDFEDGATVAWEVGFGTVLNLTAENADEETTNVALDVFYSEAADLDVALSATELTSDGLVEMLGATLAVELLNLTGTIGYNVDVTGEYDTGDVMPYFGFGYGSDTIFDLNVGVELYAGLTGIDNTTITLDYVSTDLSTDNGIITVEAAVSL